MTKRRRFEDLWDELPAIQESGNSLTVSAKAPTVGHAQLEGVPNSGSNMINEDRGRQLAVGDLANVVTGRAVGPRGTEGVLTNLIAPTVAEVDTPRELGRPGPEPAPANRLREGEVDVAGLNLEDPYWFWELLAEVGWDVW